MYDVRCTMLDIDNTMLDVEKNIAKNITSNKIVHQTSNIKHCVAILPGSRQQEIIKKLPIMLEVAKAFPNYQFVVAKAPGLEDSFYEPFYEMRILRFRPN